MNKEDKLKNIIGMLDSLAKLDDKFWIDKTNLKKIYTTISNIENEEQFNEVYKLILVQLSLIFDKLAKLDKKIDNIYIKNEEKMNKLSDDDELSNIEKNFNI